MLCCICKVSGRSGETEEASSEPQSSAAAAGGSSRSEYHDVEPSGQLSSVPGSSSDYYSAARVPSVSSSQSDLNPPRTAAGKI